VVVCEGSVDDSAGGRPRILLLCWERIARRRIVERWLTDVRSPFAVDAVEAVDGWRRNPFARQVDEIDTLLDTHAVAVAHGYDAWVLMAAAEQRAARAASLPYLLLLNPVLGASQHLNGALVGYRAPRGTRVRTAFGLDAEEDGCRQLIERTTYVFGDHDRYSAQRDWSYLRGLGSRVHTIRGWHRINWAGVEGQLREVFADYAAEIAERLRQPSADPRDLLSRAAGS